MLAPRIACHATYSAQFCSVRTLGTAYTVEECCAGLSGRGYSIIDTDPVMDYDAPSDAMVPLLSKRELETWKLCSAVLASQVSHMTVT